MYTAEGLSIGEITRRINAEGIPTRKASARWERSTVWAVLRNSAYRGVACFGKARTSSRTRVIRGDPFETDDELHGGRLRAVMALLGVGEHSSSMDANMLGGADAGLSKTEHSHLFSDADAICVSTTPQQRAADSTRCTLDEGPA
jgi:hypothetical protein